jgi:hypothetical protein
MTIETSTLHLDDTIDVRDIIERIEELESSKDDHEAEPDNGHWSDDDTEEMQTLADLMDELKGNGGDEQWRGDWYPVTLIRESHFEEAMDELVADCYKWPKDLPSFMTITLDYVALQQDYSTVEIDGVTFFYR